MFNLWGLATSFLFLLLVYRLWLNKKKINPSSLSFSSLSLFKSSSTAKTRLQQILPWLELLSLGLLLIALTDPHFYARKEWKPDHLHPYPTEGIAIYLLIDQSGSMKESVEALMNDGTYQLMPKIDLAKQVTHDFILGNSSENLPGRPNDLIGLISFARAAHILSPLTLDHRAIDQELQNVNVVTKQEDDGTSIGYAIYKTVNLIAETREFAKEVSGKEKPAYEIKNSIIIVVTDGLQAPSPLDEGKRLRNIDLPEAADYAKKEGIRLYIVNVDPSIASPDLSPQRNQMERITRETGGNFYMAFGSRRLSDVYQEINRIEKNSLPVDEQALLKMYSKKDLPQYYRKISFSLYFIALGALLAFAVILMKTLYLRKIP